MPMTVITLSKVPPALRGDLTKWMQEIATGVYIGNFNSKIREELWTRIKNSIGNGEATISYAHRNELGYTFETCNSSREKIDFDGIHLVFHPKNKKDAQNLKPGFSKAATYRRAKQYTSTKKKKEHIQKDMLTYVVLDIETSGLDKNDDHIIEIGALKVKEDQQETFQMLVQTDLVLKPGIIALTGITNERLQEKGQSIRVALEQLKDFIENYPIVGYAIDFDISFINAALVRTDQGKIKNKTFDLMQFVKSCNMFLDNYKLQTVLEAYGINKQVPHSALQDARLIYELGLKVNGFEERLKKLAGL